MKTCSLAIAAIICSLCLAHPAAAQGKRPGATFQGFGMIAGGRQSAFGMGVVDRGRVAVGAAYVGTLTQAFRWTEHGGMAGLGYLPGMNRSTAWDVSANGRVIVGDCGSNTRFEAFIWTEETGMVGLGYLPGSSVYSRAYAVSADGRVVVGYSTGPNQRPVCWTRKTGIVPLGGLPGGSGYGHAYGVSADGSVVVGKSSSGQGETQAFRWTPDGGMVGLGYLDNLVRQESCAADVSADGATAIGYCLVMGAKKSFRWTKQQGMVDLGDLSDGIRYNEAKACSADGSVIVGTASLNWRPNPNVSSAAYIWTPDEGMRKLQDVLVEDYGLDLGDWLLMIAYNVSPDGRTIVGRGYNPRNGFEGWIATLPPERPKLHRDRDESWRRYLPPFGGPWSGHPKAGAKTNGRGSR